MIGLYGNAAGVDSSHKDVEAFVSRLDSIPGVALQKVQAHGSLMGWYHDPKDEPVIDRHLKRVLELAPGLTAAEQKEADYQIMAAYKDVAMRQATALHVDSALATLQAIPSRFPGIPSAKIKSWIAPAIEFYRQVGHPGHALNADYEINGKAAPITGGVSIISFTANWCAPCKLSYAPMEALLKRYGRRGLHEALAVDLDGAFDGVKMKPAQEVEAQRHYFVDEHGVTFPIALQRNVRLARAFHDVEPPADSANSDMYQISELPTFIVLDRHGIIRGALTDWDVNGRVEHSLTSLVEELLDEK
jgi:thiol-disulfide isomerase/thioredoxin